MHALNESCRSKRAQYSEYKIGEYADAKNITVNFNLSIILPSYQTYLQLALKIKIDPHMREYNIRAYTHIRFILIALLILSRDNS